jgi:uncharacterized protein (TIGR02271 family)
VTWSNRFAQAVPGAEVYGADGAKVGNIAEVYPAYIVVEKGIFFPTDYFIPLTAIAREEAGRVYLNVTKDQALHSGWDVRPTNLQGAEELNPIGTEELIETGYAAMPVAGAAGAVGAAGLNDQVVESRQFNDQGEIRIPVVEEELTATVHEHEGGAVRVTRDVINEQQTLEVPVTEERIRVERRVVDRPVEAGDTQAFDEIVIDVPLRTETVDVQKQARVAEEVVISKEAVQHTERVTDTVRREEVHVEDETLADQAIVDNIEGESARGF